MAEKLVHFWTETGALCGSNPALTTKRKGLVTCYDCTQKMEERQASAQGKAAQMGAYIIAIAEHSNGMPVEVTAWDDLTDLFGNLQHAFDTGFSGKVTIISPAILGLQERD